MKRQEIPLFKVYMSQESIDRTVDVLNSGFIGQGSVVDEFESMIREKFSWDYVLTVNSATSAEHLALHMLKKPGESPNYPSTLYVQNTPNPWPGMEPGDEVLATPLTCTASNWPILANGFNIKWVDIDPNTMNMDLDDLARKIGPKTKAIMIVHWGGYPNDLNRLKQIQERAKELYGFKPAIIEDCAHAMGSKFNGKYIGTHGNICTFSLQAIKHVTSGDGGMLFLPHNELYRRGKLLRWYGIDRESNRKDFRCEADIPEWGFKFHMNDINAAIGMGNMKKMDEIVSKHQSNAAFYDSSLKNVAGIKLLDRQEGHESAFWIYSMLVENKDSFQRWMKERGIATSQVHERNDIHSTVRRYRSILPNLDVTVPKLSSIPVGWWISEEEREYIIESIKMGW
jgi:dTDP-4-amino-4,6-dideoxygalactose transaminase